MKKISIRTSVITYLLSGVLITAIVLGSISLTNIKKATNQASEKYSTAMYDGYKTEIKSEVETAITILQVEYDKYKSGNISEEKAKENSEESEVIPPAEEPQKEDSSNEMTYTMDENDTLSNIALALFEDQTLDDKAVNKIIKNNKEAIDKRLAEKNITDDKNIATEKGILTGITLNLSKVFEEVVKNNN